MRRFWLQLPDKNEFIDINTTNNKLSLFESSTEHSFTIDPGNYSLEKLISLFIDKGLDAKLGELKADKNRRFIVFFMKDTFTFANGSFITLLGGIESVDKGDRLDDSIIHI